MGIVDSNTFEILYIFKGKMHFLKIDVKVKRGKNTCD